MALKEILLELLCSPPNNPRRLADHCRIIALAYLKMKVKSGNSFITSMGTSLDDLALDCIADLFERDDKGRYIHFEAYFDREDVSRASEAKIQSQLRRLVFSKVNDGLFRNIGIYDMSLSKIIRNLKLAADKHGLPIKRKSGDNILIFKENASSQSSPNLPPEFLEIQLTNRLNLTWETPDVLSVLNDIFLQQENYRQEYPVVQLARIIRRASIHLNDHPEAQIINQNLVISKTKLEELLRDSIRGCTECFEKTYVEKGKIGRNTLVKYLSCVENILQHHYVRDSENGDPYFNHFNDFFPEISKKEYRDNHRQYLEYMVKKVRSDLFYRVKKVI